MSKDLRLNLREAIKEGSSIIIGGDINTESTTEKWQELMDKFHLRDVTRETHGDLSLIHI